MQNHSTAANRRGSFTAKMAALRKACISPIKANYPNDFKLRDADRDPLGDRLYPT